MACWRAMAPADLDFVMLLAAQLYPDHPESRASFAGKLDGAPDACLIAERDGVPVGYCVALWATCGRPPKLDEASYAAQTPRGLHLHDIALAPAARGRGLVGAALSHLSRVAEGAPLSLVAVNGTHLLWRRHGFAEAAVDEDVRASYGAEAVYMSRST
jgi:ribosomal protein S18 acetylase RimI-like enzyme